jgi:uncharacterized small protein (TIGR04563 family)
MRATDKQKQSLYFPEETLREIAKEANRLDRSLSWTVQQAWRLARGEVLKFPSVDRRADAGRERPSHAADGGAERDASAQVREFLRGKFDREVTTS